MTDKIDISAEAVERLADWLYRLPGPNKDGKRRCANTMRDLSARLTEVEKERDQAFLDIDDNYKDRGAVYLAITRAEAAEAKLASIPSPDALIRAALEAAANVAYSQIEEPELSDNPAYIRHQPSHMMAKRIAVTIRALADDPDFIARIIKAAEVRG